MPCLLLDNFKILPFARLIYTEVQCLSIFRSLEKIILWARACLSVQSVCIRAVSLVLFAPVLMQLCN